MERIGRSLLGYTLISNVRRQALAKNAIVDIVGEAMLGLVGAGLGGYLYCYFEGCQVAMACNSHIWKVARATIILRIALNRD